ncbi:hypothetical protein Misp01_83300 [Microtetraspora sp. NBRC 13810]|uniref:polymorphic toxin-type HINT domain-containing protein n=1 Tax=Microtetraspora sp. NBRC 13810 TaxID=3030990 RepID=UPI0024A073DB|nr:polymorphic toxin-type HINT domain-containing protein [Microtetraspora sp. NBRC 13810]GLW13202.1 hypothetical protein Misp01_83300 [Microtetraspora sp. NBRC 13810]
MDAFTGTSMDEPIDMSLPCMSAMGCAKDIVEEVVDNVTEDVVDEIIEQVAPELPLVGLPGDGLGSCDRRPNSFVPGTPVLMANGTSKPIEDVKAGEYVLATDPETGVTGPRPVTMLITGNGTKNLVKLTIDIDGTRGTATDVLTATDEHPFWIPALREWLPAGQLQPGMWLQTSAGTHVQLTAVQKWTTTQRVHNLTVDELHTYHVVAVDQAILVHNDDPRNGGWYGGLQPAGDGKEINHIPPHSVNPFSHHMGSAIRMDKLDHRAVNSTGSSGAAKRWRQAQKDLIDSGDIRGAMQMDVDDIRSRYGSKYDDAIQEMYDSLDSNKAWRDYTSGC